MPESNVTFYRYYDAESDTKYTALKFKGAESIRQVKPAPPCMFGLAEEEPKKTFSSLEDWLATIPGNPTEEDVKISESYGLANVDPAWNVPEILGPCQMHWPTYIYLVLMQYDAKLKTNVELRDAFNHLVAVEKSFQLLGNSFVILDERDKTYPEILLKTLKPSQEEWEALPVDFYYRTNDYNVLDKSKKTILPQVYEAYKSLYDLMDKVGFLAFIRSTRRKLKEDALEKRIYKATQRLYNIQYYLRDMKSKEANQMLLIHKLKEELKNLE
jgi:hypothetical protein